jgi:aminomuconate-semialdehyde/2-hydroxymuconate-6-semialdehyde dehydrogenase
VVCPWNLPLLLMTWKVGPALACGNTVVVKPSEETPRTATLLGEVMNAVGVPKGVYNVVHGFGPNSAGEFLTTHQGVNGITFTGETRTGAAIMKAAPTAAGRCRSKWAARTRPSSFADATSMWRSKRRCVRASRTAARSAWAPSACMSSARCSKPSSPR